MKTEGGHAPSRMLAGQHVLVIGVGHGLGREISLCAVRDGAEVTVVGRTEATLRGVAAEIDPGGTHVHVAAADIGREDDVERLVSEVQERFGRLDGLVLCAVHDTGLGGIESTTEQEWRESFETNVFATARVVKAAVPLLKVNGGSIVFIGSQQWTYPARDFPQLAYGATKGAAISMMYALSRELGPHDIRVNTVAPSWMWGPSVEEYVDRRARRLGSTPDEVKAGIQARFALDRIPSDADVAEVVCFFLSERARSVSGQALLVNAGELGR